MVASAGVRAGFAFGVHPHMLRHAAGYKLANDSVDTRTIQAYLGHKSIRHTVRYTELALASSRVCGNRETPASSCLRIPIHS